MFAIAKGKQQDKIRQLQCQEQRIGRSYPIFCFLNLSDRIDKFNLESKNEISFGSCSRQRENGPFAEQNNKLKDSASFS